MRTAYFLSFIMIISSLGGSLAHADASASSSSTLSTQESTNSPKFGFNLDPIWLAFGGIGAKAEYFLTNRVSLGVSGTYIPSHSFSPDSSSDSSNTTDISNDSYNWEHSEIFLGTNIMLTGTLGGQGIYINPAIGYQHTAISNYSIFQLSGSQSTPAARLTLGYQWVLARHLRLAAGGGLMLTPSSSVDIKDSYGNEVSRQNVSSLGGAALDLEVGYVF